MLRSSTSCTNSYINSRDAPLLHLLRAHIPCQRVHMSRSVSPLSPLSPLFLCFFLPFSLSVPACPPRRLRAEATGLAPEPLYSFLGISPAAASWVRISAAAIQASHHTPASAPPLRPHEPQPKAPGAPGAPRAGPAGARRRIRLAAASRRGARREIAVPKRRAQLRRDTPLTGGSVHLRRGGRRVCGGGGEGPWLWWRRRRSSARIAGLGQAARHTHTRISRAYQHARTLRGCLGQEARQREAGAGATDRGTGRRRGSSPAQAVNGPPPGRTVAPGPRPARAEPSAEAGAAPGDAGLKTV